MMPISDIEQRILDKLDHFDNQLDDLCTRLTRVETTVTNHLDHQVQKFNRTTVLVSIAIGLIGVVAFFK